ncbi:MAG: four helix bundle suffix domain-containing protein [Dysgonamonadaceae bacterium]|nr:four helix bundle suffix domain-containing protein [Dysgonamonadaceae bacterium]
MENKLIRPPGDYRKLFCYQKSEAIYDITFHFVHTYLKRGDRTIDQMLQAARSTKQNIVEGYSRTGTSKETALKLVDVAKSSALELLSDYTDYLRARNLRQWEENSKELQAMRKVGRVHNDSAFYRELIQTRPPETIANISICLLKQNDYLIAKLLDSLSKAFLEEGGFRERMTNQRIKYRGR